MHINVHLTGTLCPWLNVGRLLVQFDIMWRVKLIPKWFKVISYKGLNTHTQVLSRFTIFFGGNATTQKIRASEVKMYVYPLYTKIYTTLILHIFLSPDVYMICIDVYILINTFLVIFALLLRYGYDCNGPLEYFHF